MLKQADLLDLVRETLWPQFRKERDRLDRIDKWYRWEPEAPRLPRGATAELKYLLELSKTPWLNIVVTSVAQTLFVDGYRSPEARASETNPLWRTWQANKFNVRQTAIHRAALGYGHAYATVLPGVDNTGPRAVMRGVSPRRMLAVYQDPATDDWPMYTIQCEPQGKSWALKVMDEEAVYYLTLRETPGRATGGYLSSDVAVDYIEWREHGVGVCPAVRYTNMLDLDGRTPGEVEPLIPIAARINKTDYDRLLVQHFNSWKVRTISGLSDFADNEEEANRKKLRLRQDDILVAEDHDTKFGTLDETPMEGFIAAKESDVYSLSALSQVPSTALMPGKISNVSADTIAELRAGLMQKSYERQVSFGESHTQLLRKAADIEGREDLGDDVLAEVTWQDTSVRSMAQAADALGKYATMLGVPAEELWGKIPGVTKTEVDDWKTASRRQRGAAVIQALGTTRPAPEVPADANGA